MKFSLNLAVGYLATFATAAAIDTRADDASLQRFKDSVKTFDSGLILYDIVVKVYNQTVSKTFADQMVKKGTELGNEPELAVSDSLIVLGAINDAQKEHLPKLVTDLRNEAANVKAAGYCKKYNQDILDFINGGLWLLASITTKMPEVFKPVMERVYGDFYSQLSDARNSYNC